MPNTQPTAMPEAAWPAQENRKPVILDFAANSAQPAATTLCGDDHYPLVAVSYLQHAVHGRPMHADIQQWPDDVKKALAELQTQFEHTLYVLPYRQVVEEGHVNQLLDDYLGLLLIAAEADTQANSRYAQERDYYYNHPRMVKELATSLRYMIKR